MKKKSSYSNEYNKKKQQQTTGVVWPTPKDKDKTITVELFGVGN